MFSTVAPASSVPVDTSSTVPTTNPPVPATQPAEPSRMLSTCHHHAKAAL